MLYADYTYYTDTYKGKVIPMGDYDRLALKASAYLDKLTRGGIKETTEPVKMAACAVAEAWHINEQGGDVASQSVGSWSRSYTKQAKSDDERLYEAAMLYLSDIIYMSRWL